MYIDKNVNILISIEVNFIYKLDNYNNIIYNHSPRDKIMKIQKKFSGFILKDCRNCLTFIIQVICNIS